MSLPDNECRKCGEKMDRRDGMFFWRGAYYPGHVCNPCNALYPIAGEEMPPLRKDGEQGPQEDA